MVSRLVASVIVGAWIVTTAAAQPGSPQPSPAPDVTAFLANPAQLLQQNPNGDTALSNAVQALALADPSSFKALIGLVATANDAQKRALGTGLAQATKIEVMTNQALATEWQQQIAAITDPIFKIAATDAFGDIALAATGSGAVGAAGNGLGGPGNGPGSIGGGLENIGSTPVATSPFSLTSSIAGGAVPITNGVTTSVSP
jgi:hypothetical protein